VRLLPPLIIDDSRRIASSIRRRLIAPDSRGSPVSPAWANPATTDAVRKHAQPPRHFLTLLDLNADRGRALLQRAIELKRMLADGVTIGRWPQRTLAWCSRSRPRAPVSRSRPAWRSSAAMRCSLSPRDTQLGRGEPIEDSARVLSRMVDAVMMRTFDHDRVERFAAYSRVPVINGLTDRFHPCQLLADMQTYLEHRGRHPRAHGRLRRRRQQHVPLLHQRGAPVRLRATHRLPGGLRARGGPAETRARPLHPGARSGAQRPATPTSW
jgi:hypothetical protein